MCSIIVLNLGSGQLAAVAKIAIVIDLAFSYPLVMAPAREVIELSMLHDDSPWLETKRNIIRVLMVAATSA